MLHAMCTLCSIPPTREPAAQSYIHAYSPPAQAPTPPPAPAPAPAQVSLLRSCRDANIVTFLGACINARHEAMLVTEFVELGDLWRAATLRNARGARIFAWQNR